MATNDTDPQREQPIHDDTSRTDPDGASASDAAALLAGLAETAQPAPNVPETEGHVAAAYAGAPRRPPRPNDKTVENPAVFINATVPLPPPPSSSHHKLGPPAPPVVSMKGDPTVLGGARLFEALQNQTDPGERARNQLRVYFAAIAGVIVAALIAITVLVLQRTPKAVTSSSSSSSSSAPSTESPSTPPATAVVTPSTAPTVAPTPTPSSAAALTATPPTLTTKPTQGRPHGSASPTSPRPSATFAEPDRHL